MKELNKHFYISEDVTVGQVGDRRMHGGFQDR